MRLLILGANGQVGWELQRALAPLGEIVALDRRDADLSQPQTLAALVSRQAPDVIVNAAAYTAVDRAESEPDLARAINADSVAALAAAAAQSGAWLIQYSTDYVYPGDKAGAYVETDATGPLGVYGATKLAGEDAIRASGCRHLIMRTSWVYADRGANFVRTMLRLAKARDELNVVADQFGAPTAAALIADVTALIVYRLATDPALAQTASGTYHLVAAGETSWHGFARFVIGVASDAGAALKATPATVLPIPTEAYPTPAARPKNSRLDTTKLRQTFGLDLPDWTHHARRVVATLTQETPQ